MFRNGVHALTTRDPDLHRPEVVQVARHGRLGGFDAVVGQEAAQLLAPALRIIEDASGLVPVLETLEEHATSPHERASYHTELADLYLEPLESTVLGQVHLRTALEFTPGDMDLRDRLIVLARELDQLSDHVDVLDRIAEIADEPILQVALVQEAAMLAVEELGDLEGGMNHHAKIIKEIDGENRLSLEMLLNHTEENRAFGSFLGWIDHALEVRFEADERRPLFVRAVEAALANNQNSRALQYLDQAEGEFTDDLAFLVANDEDRLLDVALLRECDSMVCKFSNAFELLNDLAIASNRTTPSSPIQARTSAFSRDSAMNPRTPANGKGDREPSVLIQPVVWNSMEDILAKASAAVLECCGADSSNSPSKKEKTDQVSPR